MPVSDGEGVDPFPPDTVEMMSQQGQDNTEKKKKLEDAIDSAGDGLGPEGTNTPGGEQAASQGAMGGNSSPFEFYTGPVVAVTPGLKSGFGLGWVNSDIGYTPEGSPGEGMDEGAFAELMDVINNLNTGLSPEAFAAFMQGATFGGGGGGEDGPGNDSNGSGDGGGPGDDDGSETPGPDENLDGVPDDEQTPAPYVRKNTGTTYGIGIAGLPGSDFNDPASGTPTAAYGLTVPNTNVTVPGNGVAFVFKGSWLKAGDWTDADQAAYDKRWWAARQANTPGNKVEVASPFTQGGESGGGSRSIVRSTTTRTNKRPVW